MKKITKEQFVEKSMKSATKPTKELIKLGFLVPVPCVDCDYEKCEGWKWVRPQAATRTLKQ